MLLKSFLLALVSASSVGAFAPLPFSNTQHRQSSASSCMSLQANNINEDSSTSTMNKPKDRRGFLVTSIASVAAAVVLTTNPPTANAIPMITTDEFNIILRDSPYSIQVVEFSGPKSETVTAKLVDGTQFGLKDVIESSTDPRSPLKVAAACRENGVPTKFTTYEAVLAASPKKKLYTNERVQEAAKREQEKKERMQRDEEARLEALRQLEAEEAAAEAAAAATK